MNHFRLPRVKVPIEFQSTGYGRQTSPSGPHGGLETPRDGPSSKTYNLEDERAAANRKIAEHSVFAWMRWAPEINSPLENTLRRHFPGALPGHAVHERTRY